MDYKICKNKISFLRNPKRKICDYKFYKNNSSNLMTERKIEDIIITNGNGNYNNNNNNNPVEFKESEKISIKSLNSYIKNKLKLKLTLQKQIGQGGFGVVYAGRMNHKTIAVKVEKVIDSHDESCLLDEYKIYSRLNGKSHSSHSSHGSHDNKEEDKSYGLPKCLYFNPHDKHYKIMVLPMYGDNLEYLMKRQSEQRFSHVTVLKIGYQVLILLEKIHQMGIVHLDVKPDNILTLISNNKDQGLGNSLLTLIDYGLSKTFEERNGLHKKQKSGDFRGSNRYMSLNIHRGESPSRRDDFQSLAYTLIYLAKGSLPWQGINDSNTSKVRDIIYTLKKETCPKELCHGLPQVFEQFLKYSIKLRFEERPDYDTFKNRFFNTIVELTGQPGLDYKMDWN